MEKDCDNLVEWIKPCESHLMWSAATTPSSDEELIWAKFESFLSHIINKHTDLPNENFNKCAHGEAISDRRWLEEGICIYACVYIHVCVYQYGCMGTKVLSPSLEILIRISSCRQLFCLENDI